MSFNRSLVALAVAGTIVGFAAAASSPAAAAGTGVSWSSVVSAVPSAATPNITDGTVYAITQVGNTVVVGGSFTGVQNHNSTVTIARNFLLAFDATTGAVTSFAPTLDKQVESLAPGPAGSNSVYVGGDFNTVNGVKSKGVTLLDVGTGAIVSGFKPPSLNGIVYSVATSSTVLYIAGSFTTAAGAAHGGIASLNPTTGALTPFVNVQFAGHHNYNGTGAKGAVGPRSMAVNPQGTRAVVVGNFKTADGVVHDQIAVLDLDGASATVDPWNTAAYTGPCIRGSFDSYVRDVQYSADGSYFAVVATGGTGGTNTDGTTPLCDSASRWESSATGANVRPTWVDFTGRDSLWSVAITDATIYVGGHERWLNNSSGFDNAKQGAVPRPAIAALDPVSGVPQAWNAGRNPRGAGTFALFASSTGLYVGGDQDYVGNFKYFRGKVAFFPLAGGYTPASTATAQLPANLYQAGPLPSSTALAYRSFDGTVAGTQTVLSSTGIDWSTTRGAFAAGGFIYYGQSGNFYRVSFDGTSVGTPELQDAYDDPIWATQNTGSGQTYQGVKPTYLTSELPTVTGAFYSAGRLYYTLAGKTTLYSRLFTTDSGIIGSQEFTAATTLPSTIAGMTLSGSTLYYATAATGGALHSRSFLNATANPTTNGTVGATDTTVNTNDWRARSLFLFRPASFGNSPPTAVITSASCTGLSCNFDGSGSSDPDNDPLTYSWDFGDGTNGSGVTTTHNYQTADHDFTVTLTVNDGRGGTNSTSTVVHTGVVATIAFVGQNSVNPTANTNAPTVNIPAGANPGDTELLFASVNIAGKTTTPAGWEQVGQLTNTSATSGLETTVFRHIAAAGDPTSVTVPLTSAQRADLQIVVYTGVADQDPTLATVGDVNTNTHTTPTANVTDAGSQAISYWSDRTSATQETWTLPAGLSHQNIDAPASGAGRVDSAIADASAPTGSYGHLTATVAANVVAGRGNMVTVILAPALG